MVRSFFKRLRYLSDVAATAAPRTSHCTSWISGWSKSTWASNGTND